LTLPSPRADIGYLVPQSPAEAVALAARPGHVLAAGATTFAIAWEAGTPPPAALVDVGAIPALNGIDVTPDGTCTLGAAVTVAEIAARTDLLPEVLVAAARGIGAPPVRALATLGGNLAWGAGDLAGALAVLDATLELETRDGRVTLSVPAYAGGPRPDPHVIVRIHFRLGTADGARSAYEKIGTRAEFSPTRVALALVRVDGHWRLAAHGEGLAMRRLVRTEAALAAGTPIETALGEDLADVRAPYALQVLPRLVAWHQAQTA